MGGSSSKTTMDVYTSNIVDALSRSIQNCSGNTIINQQVVIKGNYNVVKNVRMVQGMKLSTSCSADIQNVSATQQAVENAIKQQSEAQNVALLGAVSSSSSMNETKIRNEVRAAITQETIQNIINNFNATQEFYLDGNSNIVEDITMEQSMEVLQENCLKALNKIATVQEIKNKAESASKATQSNPVSDVVGAVGSAAGGIIDSIGSIFTSLGGMWTIIIIVALVVGGYIVVNGGFLGAMFGGDTPTQDPQLAAMQQQNRARVQGAIGLQPRPIAQMQSPYNLQQPQMGLQPRPIAQMM